MFKQVRLNDAILKFYRRSQPIAFSNAETLYDDLVLLRDQILMYGDLSEAQTNYLNNFIDQFDTTLSTTVRDIFEKWLGDGFLSEFLREIINEEVVEARDGEAKLNLRLIRDKQDSDNEIDLLKEKDNQLTDRLEQKAQQSYVENELLTKRDKSVSIGLNDIDATLADAISGGTTVNVLSKPRANSVTPNTIAGIKNANLFNKATRTDGYYVSNTGDLTPSGFLYHSDFIPVNEGETYTIPLGETSQGGFYDKTETWVSAIPGVDFGEINTFVVPNGVEYLRVNGMISNVDTSMLLIGDVVPSSFIPYGGSVDWLRVDNINLGVDSVNEVNIQNNSVSAEKINGHIYDNMFDKTTITLKKYIDNSGSILDHDILCMSDFIPVLEGQKYTITQISTSPGGIYDKNMIWIAPIPNPGMIVSEWTITVPTNGAYIRLNMYVSEPEKWMMVEGVDYPETYLPYGATISWLNLDYKIRKQIEKEHSPKWFEKKVVTFGDSITWYDGNVYGANTKESGTTVRGYQYYMREELGATVINQGVSGNTTPQINTRIKAYDYTGIDAVTILTGTNDFRDIATEQLGSIQPIGSVFDNTTFIGAYQEAIEYILSVNPEIKVYLLTQIKAWTNANGLMPETYPNAVKELGELYSLSVCDLYNESGINDLTKGVYIVDTETVPFDFHPSTKGYARMANIIVPFMKNH